MSGYITNIKTIDKTEVSFRAVLKPSSATFSMNPYQVVKFNPVAIRLAKTAKNNIEIPDKNIFKIIFILKATPKSSEPLFIFIIPQ